MTLLVLIAISAAVAAGVYLLLSRDLFRVVIGLSVLGGGVNLIVFAAGRFSSTAPPLLETAGDAELAAASHPLVQALVLTAIVISFALLCFALLLGAMLRAAASSDHTGDLRRTEPRPADPVKPPMEDEP